MATQSSGPVQNPWTAPTQRRQPALGWLTGRAAAIEAFRVMLDPAGAIVPTRCACCGRAASLSRAERRRDDAKTLIVPYCGACHDHASAAQTRVLALSLAGLLCAIGTAAALPLLWDWVTAPVYLLSVLFAAALPAAVGPLLRTGPGAHPHAPGRAAWWTRGGGLTCTNRAWATELAHANRAPIEPCYVRERLWSPWMLSATVMGVVAAPFWLSYQRAELRVLNLTESRLVLSADGHPLAVIEPSSAESPAAGVDVRIPAGRRTLEVRTQDGRMVQRTSAFVQAGRQHLYAPASPTFCFWLETTDYARQAASQVEPLVDEDRFWLLPTDLDTWFAPNPPAASPGVRSTGGVLVALRQGRCADAPVSSRLPSLSPKRE
ncbi:MAG: hypothetical protein JW940_34450 [Polyangiaceae bacterium]|nr:hypothetical protein [Polyangiaceae bacterium]